MVRTCDGCKFCCWSFNVEVPHPRLLQILEPKHEGRHCHYECATGCTIHDGPYQPEVCRVFKCPYLTGEDVYKPGDFQELIEDLHGSMGNYVPAVPTSISKEEAVRMILSTRSLPAFILVNNEWTTIILPLDREPDGAWENDWARAEWKNLCDIPTAVSRLSSLTPMVGGIIATLTALLIG